VIFFEPKRRYWTKGDIADQPTPFDQARVVRTGRDVTVVAYGPMVATALDSATLAAEEGHDLEVIDLRSLSPLDTTTVVESVRRTGRLVVVHEASVSHGVGAEVAARVQEKASTRWRRRCCGSAAWICRIRRVGWRRMAARVDRVLDAVDRILEHRSVAGVIKKFKLLTSERVPRLTSQMGGQARRLGLW
jgi:pyruvate dehydrogenase E1 component beta subunit